MPCLYIRNMRFALYLFILLLPNFTSAQTDSLSFDLQGHRGCRGLMPENTIPAMLKALDLGVQTLELDVVISADKQVVVSHEPWINADICLDTTGSDLSNSKAKQLNIYRMRYAEIQQYDCGSRKFGRFPEQEKLPVFKPLLSDLIEVCERYSRERKLPPVRYNIEIKSSPQGDNKDHPAPEEFVALVMATINRYGIASRTTIQSFDLRPLQLLNKQNANVTLAFLTESEDDLESVVEELGFIPDIFSPAFKLVDRQLVSACRKQNVRIIPWTVNEVDQMEKLIKMGVDGLITDYPDRALPLLKRPTEN